MAVLTLGLTALPGFAAPELVFALPVGPRELVTDEAKFRIFAENVRTEVERLLGVPAAVDDPATLRRLLSTRVHLAHDASDDEKAISTAAWIRSLQTDLPIRAFTGLTMFAPVEARRQNRGAAPDDAKYRETFLRELTPRLASLPRTAEITAMLRDQREKIGGLTKAALLAETRDTIIPALARREHCGLAGTDQLVRAGHRLVSILLARNETLRALDVAVAARPAP